MRTKRPIRCTNHCGKCGAHFISAIAFYAHRRGKYRPKPGERGRYCVAPEDAAGPNGDDLFMAVTHNGICNMTHGLKKNVTVWALAISYRRLNEAAFDNSDGNPTAEEIARGGPSPRRARRRRRSNRWGRTLDDVR